VEPARKNRILLRLTVGVDAAEHADPARPSLHDENIAIRRHTDDARFRQPSRKEAYFEAWRSLRQHSFGPGDNSRLCRYGFRCKRLRQAVNSDFSKQARFHRYRRDESGLTGQDFGWASVTEAVLNGA